MILARWHESHVFPFVSVAVSAVESGWAFALLRVPCLSFVPGQQCGDEAAGYLRKHFPISTWEEGSAEQLV